MEELLLGAVYGLGLGVVAGSTLSVMGPFSRGNERRWESVALLAALCALSVGGGVLVLDSWTVAWIAAMGTAAGVGVFWLLGRATPEAVAADPTQPLSVAELRRPKTADDCWLLVTGSPASGKTALVARMVDEARRSGRLRLAAPPRTGEDGDLRVAELHLLTAGRVRTLRFWERSWGGAGRREPAPSSIDGVVVAIDPTCVNDTAESFPAAVKAGPSAVDVNTQAIALDASLAKAGGTAIAWYVITKADLIRFSINAELIKLVKAGTGWHEQLGSFDIPRRRELASCLGIDTSERAAMQQGQGSPFLAYAGRGPVGSGSFGGKDLLGAIIGELMPEVLLQGGGDHVRWSR